MRIEYGSIHGDQVLSEDLALYGLATGSLTIGAGHALYLYGMCNGNVIVEAGASATLLGTVAGDVVNRGTAVLHGVVQGGVYSKGASLTKSPTSVVVGPYET